MEKKIWKQKTNNKMADKLKDFNNYIDFTFKKYIILYAWSIFRENTLRHWKQLFLWEDTWRN